MLLGNGRSILTVRLASGITLFSVFVLLVLKSLLTAWFLRGGEAGVTLIPTLATNVAAGVVLVLLIGFPGRTCICLRFRWLVQPGYLRVTPGSPIWAAISLSGNSPGLTFWLFLVFC